MSYRTIKLQTDTRGITTLTLCRPEKHNAMNTEMMSEITDAVSTVSDDPDIRAVILTAQGQSFCAGADLNWMREQAKADRDGKIKEARKLASMLAMLNDLPKPLIGRIEGNAYGGGIGLMAVCDIVIACEGLRFALTETKLGLIPATIGPFVVRRMGETYARQVFITAKSFSTDFAFRSGLVSSVCKASDMDAAIETVIVAILKTAPGAVADAKKLISSLAGKIDKTDIEMTINALADRWETDEAQTRIATFLEGMK